ncbi:TetR/AcrR family transcriptional regulator [Cupriavidus basilensis]|uniref:Transcriptional regulator, TetR family n=1 Tax=Cupriavidus basilensis TaxID=68895 RepID=A0A0C4YWS1_9BURK|nr:TetR/AcrR family transcriptional regulator [Cupriavidus basilensis]AJG24941.1 Transcriptional regulator, TetR family [Cupriavidus basilensis]
MTDTDKKPRGRPPKPEAEIQALLVTSAMEVLLERGYEATTVEAIAAKAGVAKKTVYRLAANRDELVGMAVRAWTDGFAGTLAIDASQSAEVMGVLRSILEQICAHVLTAEAVSMFRLLTTDFRGKGELLAAYERNGIARGRALLGEWLERQHRHKMLNAPDPRAAAGAILAIAVTEPLRQMAIGVATPIERVEDVQHLDACMGIIGRIVGLPATRS